MGKAVEVLAKKANGAPIKSVYVFGERNSGTNYVSALVMKNCLSPLDLRGLYDGGNRTAFGWKHGFPTFGQGPDDVLAIAVYRDPLAWLHSMNRTPWNTPARLRGLPFSQFIRSEWMSIINDSGFGVEPGEALWLTELMADRNPATGARFANPMQLRNAKNRGFASLDGRFGNVLRVTYETVLADPQAFLNALCNLYRLPRLRRFDPILHDRATPVRGVYQPKPLPETSAEDLEFIASQLDLGFEARLGYHLPQPQTLPAPRRAA